MFRNAISGPTAQAAAASLGGAFRTLTVGSLFLIALSAISAGEQDSDPECWECAAPPQRVARE